MLEAFNVGLFLFTLCTCLLIGQTRLLPGCPKWLRPLPEAERMKHRPMSRWGFILLAAGIALGLILHVTNTFRH